MQIARPESLGRLVINDHNARQVLLDDHVHAQWMLNWLTDIEHQTFYGVDKNEREHRGSYC